MEPCNIKDLLEEKEIKPSLHRIKILDYLMVKKNHPTVEMIYADLSTDIPTLSKTTIYNTLKTFIEKGIVQLITIEENEARFDAAVEHHAHLKCIKCSSLYDVETNTDILKLKSIDGHQILESQLYFQGVCNVCNLWMFIISICRGSAKSPTKIA